jgi:hypothetical protein
MANEELIGFNKGALATLIKEREELMKILTIVEQLMKFHMENLKKLGVDLSPEHSKKK